MSFSYDDYLLSEHWTNFKEAYRKQKDLPQECVVCGSQDFQLHHRTYCRIGMERLTDVIPLCRPHHQQLHEFFDNNKKWRIENSFLALQKIHNWSYKVLNRKSAGLGKFVDTRYIEERKQREFFKAEIQRQKDKLLKYLVQCEKCGKRGWQENDICSLCKNACKVIFYSNSGKKDNVISYMKYVERMKRYENPSS